ncbi:MAG: membrane dipeptidase [Sedimentisphaerales bacterium]|nr:membrane dipeptidase [Sedimentisphaerales bacterium]
MAQAKAAGNDYKQQAIKLHAESVIIDAHNDHFALKRQRGKAFNLMLPDRRYHSDGPSLLKAGVTTTLFYVGGNDLPVAMVLMEQTLREIENNSESLLLVKSARDITRAHKQGKLGIMMIWEGAQALCDERDILHLIYRLGVRSITLTHGQGREPYALQGTRSYFGYCTDEDRRSFRRVCQGLTAFGCDVVREMNRLGMLVDVAHINDAAFYDVMELSDQPVVATHGGVFACCEHSRCLTDDMIKALAAKQGVLGIAFFHKFIAQRGASIDKIVDQIAYVADLVGIEYVGIGSDFDGLPAGVLPVVKRADRLPELTEAMLRRGFRPNEVKKVLGGNFLRVFKAVLG